MDFENGTIRSGSGSWPIVFSCEHASRVVPKPFELGIAEEECDHCEDMADKGAEDIYDFLVSEFDACGIKSKISRLVIDMNRHLEDPSLIRPHINEKIIPANHNITHEDRKSRVERFYIPYHQKLHRLLKERTKRHGRVFYFMIHTMAQICHGERREMDISLLSLRKTKLTAVLKKYLEQKGYAVTNNDPFSLKNHHSFVRCPCDQDKSILEKSTAFLDINDKHINNEELKKDLAQCIRATITELQKA